MSTLESSNKQSMAKGFVILSIAGLLVKFISLLYSPFLNQIVGETGVGIYSTTYQVFTFIYIITNSGTSIAISKGVSEQVALGNGRDAHRIFTLSRLMLAFVGMIGSLFMFIFAEQLAAFMETPSSALALKVLSPTIFLTSLLSAYRGYFQGREIMTPTGVSQVFEQVANTIFSLLFAYILIKNFTVVEGVAGGTVGTSIGAMVALLIVMYFYRKNKYDKAIVKNRRVLSDREIVKKVLGYSVPITICMAIQQLSLLIDPKIIRIRLADIGVLEEGINALVGQLFNYNQLIFVPITIITALSAAVIPAVTNAVARKDKEEAVYKINYAYKLCFMIAIPSAIGLATLAIPICTVLGFEEGVAKLLIYGSFVLIFMAIMQIQTSILQGLGKLYYVTGIAAIAIIPKIITNYYFIGIPEVNIFGALIGNLVGFLVIIILNSILIKKELKRNGGLLVSSLKPSISSAIMGAVVLIVSSSVMMILGDGWVYSFTATVLSIALGGIAYGIAMILTGGLTKKDFDMFPGIILRIIPRALKNRLK